MPNYAILNRKQLLALSLGLIAVPVFRAYAVDPALQEALDRLDGQIEDLKDGQTAQRREVDAVAKEIESIGADVTKPPPARVSIRDLELLAAAVRDVDQRRIEGYAKIHAEIMDLGRALIMPPSPPRGVPSTSGSEGRNLGESETPQRGYEYVVQPGDTLSAIVRAYRQKNIRVSLDQILNANPGLRPQKLRLGQKVFIPAPMRQL